MMVVQSQLFFTASSSCTWPSGKYDVMRWPSAYWATSSGIAMLSGRVSTHPTLPSCVRIRFQSSMGTSTGGAAGGGGATGTGSVLGAESASQLPGSFGAGGLGGGPTLVCAAFGLAFLRMGAGL